MALSVSMPILITMAQFEQKLINRNSQMVLKEKEPIDSAVILQLNVDQVVITSLWKLMFLSNSPRKQID